MYLSVNLKHLRAKAGLSQQALSEKLQIARSSLAEYERGKTEPNIENLIHLAEIFNINLDDLLRKNLERETYEIIRNKDLRVLAITVDNDKNGNIELVNTKAEAGYLESAADPEYIRDLPKIAFPGFPEGTYRGFEIQGDSMLPVEPGSFVICSYVERLEQLKNDKTYVIVSRREGVVFKRIKTHPTRKSVILISDNEVYPPYEIGYDDIREIWQYYAHLSFSDSKTIMEALIDERISDIQKKVNDLHQMNRIQR